MAKSFQDQLLKAGLVNKQQLNEAKSSKHKQKKQKKPKTATSEQTTTRLTEQQRQQRRKDLELNRQLETQRTKNALANQIKELIASNMLSCQNDDIAYKFSDQGKIKQIYVSAQVQTDLAAERLQIVSYEQSYAIVPAAIAVTILQRDPAYRVIKNTTTQPEDQNYADYKVPDDLIW